MRASCKVLHLRWCIKSCGSVASGRVKRTGRAVKYERRGLFALGVNLSGGSCLRCHVDSQYRPEGIFLWN